MQSTQSKGSYVISQFVTQLNMGLSHVCLKRQIWAVCFCVGKATLTVTWHLGNTVLDGGTLPLVLSAFWILLVTFPHALKDELLFSECRWACLCLVLRNSCNPRCRVTKCAFSQPRFACVWLSVLSSTPTMAVLPRAAVRKHQVSPLLLNHLLCQISVRSQA